MALTRKALKAMGLTEEQVDSIIEAHTETVDGLKEEAALYKADAEKLPDIQKKLDDATEKLESGNKESWKVKYDAIKEEFDNYKANEAAQKTKTEKETAYRELLKGIGIDEKRVDSILRVTDVNSLELGEDKKFKDAENITETAKTEWADFITAGGENNKATPNVRVDMGGKLNNGGTAMTKNDIMSIQDRSERRAAIAANMNVFNNKGD